MAREETCVLDTTKVVVTLARRHTNLRSVHRRVGRPGRWPGGVRHRRKEIPEREPPRDNDLPTGHDF